MSISHSGKGHFLARRAKEAKYYSVIRKILVAFLVSAILLLVIVYVLSALYAKYGSFTVTVNKFDSTHYGLSLSETPQFDTPTSRLNLRASEDITNISGEDLPLDIDSINGPHSGENYLAYTYYLKNVGVDTVTFEYHMFFTNIEKELDRAIRIRIYRDGVPVTYARTRTDGKGAEEGCVEFLSSDTVVREQIKGFKPGDIMKFTIVIWIEGDDPDCTDEVIGGSIKTDMTMTVVESSAQ